MILLFLDSLMLTTMNLDLDSRHAADANNGNGAMELQLDVSSTDNTRVPSDEWDKSSGQVGIFNIGAGSRTIRRSCDRCHTQKLKCSGGRASSSQCLRCQRVGLSCSYSARSTRKDVRNTQRPELPVLDKIDLASLDTSLTMSFDMAQDGLTSSTSSEDWTWWGQPAEHYLMEQGERNITMPTSKAAPLDFMPLNMDEKVTTESESSRRIGNQRSGLFQSLADLSQSLESVLDSIVTAWPEQDIQSCTQLKHSRS